MKKIVITGGAGFIGKVLTKSLLKYNYKLFILDNLSFKQDFIKSKSGELLTPIPDSFLDGITRREVIKIAKAKGVKVIERKIKPEEMKDFEGCFLTGTAAEVTPVSQISEYKFKVCDLITDLNDSYQNLVRKKSAA